uniref:Uncharacterized protein n=1 Tax=Arundo donax TaxID=35708 RepID=A0A0A9BJH5_ARUDO
MGHQTAARWS